MFVLNAPKTNARKGGLKNLKGVDLVGIQAANNSIVPQSLSLQSLKTLQFEFKSDYSIAMQELPNLTNLEELFVYGFSLSDDIFERIRNLSSLRVLSLDGSGSPSIQGPLHLKNLESLKITNNYYLGSIFLENKFLKQIGAMSSLKILSLPKCQINGTLPAQGICELISLEELDLRRNSLTGTLPDCFSNLTSLRHLDLSSNQFSGNLSSFMSLTSMESIDLSNNQFQIPSSLKPFFNHSKLKHFYGENNRIFAEIEAHSMAPRFQLKVIGLSCCGNGGILPKFLYHQHELLYVDMSHINLMGEFPSWLVKNNTQLEALYLLNNSLSGHLKFRPFHSPRKLSVLDISKNFFDGNIPLEIGKCLPGLTFLNISKNSLDGGIPSSIGDMKLLQILDLSNNRLSGSIPESLAMSCSSLVVLILSNNCLQGQMLSSNFNLEDLDVLELGGNNFTGEVPISLSNSTSLSIIDIGDNHISGGIPRWLGNMPYLFVIAMPNNHIEGPIPTEICKLNLLRVLDISMNNISGRLPSCFGSLDYLTDLHLSKNRLCGTIPNSLCESSNLLVLDLSDNQLSGNVPSCLGNLSELSYLVLKQNNLEGEIPDQFSRLEKLGLIDLSQNNLSGGIPHRLNITTSANMGGSGMTLVNVVWDGFRSKTNSSDYKSIDWTTGSISYSFYGSIDLTMKNISYAYKARSLEFLSGIDLSCNKLTGEIPHELGNSHVIRMLNLSHNRLRGPIPPSLSNLTQIESFDLSYNNLSGGIPPQFVQLNFLAHFNVSYNNLSGKPPLRAGQFASYIDENSYLGNPFFCEECLLPNKSSTIKPTQDHDQEEDVGGFIDIESFYVTFGVSYVTVLLVIVAVLYINPHWRGAWFYFVERVIATFIYFVIDNILPGQFRFCYI